MAHNLTDTASLTTYGGLSAFKGTSAHTYTLGVDGLLAANGPWASYDPPILRSGFFAGLGFLAFWSFVSSPEEKKKQPAAKRQRRLRHLGVSPSSIALLIEDLIGISAFFTYIRHLRFIG